MRKLVNTIFYIGFLFFGGGFLIAFGQFVLYNGVGDLFSYVKAENIELTIRVDTLDGKERYIANYSYMVNQKKYNAREHFNVSYIERNNKDLKALYYNRNFPSITYVEDKNLDIRRAKGGMVVMGSFFLFLFLIYKFADIDKWIDVYTRGEYKSSKKR